MTIWLSILQKSLNEVTVSYIHIIAFFITRANNIDEVGR